MAGSSRTEVEAEEEILMMMMVQQMKENFKNNNNNNNNNHKSQCYKKENMNVSIRRSCGSWNHSWWRFLILTICCCFSHSVLGQMPSALLATTITTIAPTSAPSTTESTHILTKGGIEITAINTTQTPPLTPRVIVESIAVNDEDERKPRDGKETENFQLPHAFRHQQHYSHRIEQAVNDFRQQQMKQFQASHLKERDKFTNSKHNSNHHTKNNHAKAADKRYEKEWQTNVQAPEKEEHHQRRHEHHWLIQQEQQQKQLKDSKKTHLRHRHHYAAAAASASAAVPSSLLFSSWDQHNDFPALRHQRHRNALIIPTTTTMGPNVRDPITEADNELDKDFAVEQKNNDDNNGKENINLGLRAVNSKSLSLPTTNRNYSHGRQPPTRGPLFLGNRRPTTLGPSKLRQQPQQPQQQQQQKTYKKNIMYSDDTEEPLSGRRLSFKLHNEQDDDREFEELEEEAHEKEKSSDKITRNFMNELDDDNEDDEDDDDGGGSYSYEEDTDDNIYDASNEDNLNQYPTDKPPVKRFTNPFKNFFKSFRSNTNNEKINENNHNDKENNNNNENDDDNIPDDKLRSRVQQHHLRQQQHQHELEALRSRHGGLVVGAANNMVNSGPNKHKTNIKKQDAESTAQNYIPGSLTRQKQDELGNFEAVHESRRTHLFNQKKNKDMATAHVEHIYREAACRNPQPRVVHIEADASKRYTPHCTVLHRCADDTGCCRSKAKTCAPKRTQSVDLYFFVHRMNDKRGYIERLTFVNHTECHCVDKSREAQHDAGAYNSHRVSSSDTAYLPREQLSLQATILNCNCPNWFEKILQDDGSCRCDCSSGNMGCERFKKGLEHFSIDDRKCIKEGRCKPPTCEYGSYVKKLGACTRREEQLSGVLGAPTNTLYASGYH